MENTKKLKRIIYISSAVLFLAVFVFVSRGPYLSNALKKMILPELENMSGRKVVAQKIYINLFPLFIEAKGLKVFDESGNKVLIAERVKGYIGLSGLLRKELTVKRIVIVKADIGTDIEQIEDIVNKANQYAAKESTKKIKIKTNVIEVRDSEFLFFDEFNDGLYSGSGMSGEILMNEIPRIKAEVREFSAKVKDLPEFNAQINTTLFLGENSINVKNLNLKSYGSELQTSGMYTDADTSAFTGSLNLLVDSVKKMFGLKRKGDGKISAKGFVKLEHGIPFFDVKLSGNFYLQTLMEFFKIDERLEGQIDFKGSIAGTPADFKGTADAKLQNGNLFAVDIQELQCKVHYADGLLSFKNGKGRLYNGRGEAEAILKMPDLSSYTLKVRFEDVDGPQAFQIFGLRGIPPGKVKGELYTSDTEFNPSGWFDYIATESRNDFMGRVKTIKGSYDVKGDLIKLPAISLSTEKTKLTIKGTMTWSALKLDLDAKAETYDIADITAPYLSSLKGEGVFAGTIQGTARDPIVNLNVKLSKPVFNDYFFEAASGEISYRKSVLEIKTLNILAQGEFHSAKGSILFNNSKEIFDFKNPEYRLTVTMKNADAGKLTAIVYKKLPLKARLDSELMITGKGSDPHFSGFVSLKEGEAYGHVFDTASASIKYRKNEFILDKAVFKKNSSVVKLEGTLMNREQFSFHLSSQNFLLKDTGYFLLPQDATVSFKAEGTGTFENPSVSLSAILSGGTFKGRQVGAGTVSASIKNKQVLFESMLFNNRLKIYANAFLSKDMPWSVEIDAESGRYDFLLAGILKDIPEDLVVNMKAHASLSGNKKNINGSAVINQVNISLFGHSFSSASEMKMEIANKNLEFSSFTMRSGNASFSVKGSMELWKSYNLLLEGNAQLSPLKGFSQRISNLRGNADFTLNILGNWDNPQITGSMNVTDGLFSLKDMHQRLSNINAYFYFEEDRIIIHKLTGKFGGGDADITGTVYLKGFGIKRFSVDASVKNITAAVSRDFTVNFSGNVFYKGTLDDQIITGEVNIHRARYRERVEWKSWLLKAKPKEKPKAEPNRFEKTRLNVRMYGTDNIVVDNNIVRTQLKVDLMLRGTVGHPIFFGRVESKGGKVYFRNNEFQILNANADFADPNRINPLMEIVAQTTVKGYNIRLNLEGQIEQFTLSLISDPPLDETDILSLLTVGQTGRDLKGLEGGIGASEATAFLTGKVQDVFEDRVKNLTGLDRVQVDPYISKTTGTVGPRVTVSKRLIGDKLFVTYISAVGSTEEQVLKLEYVLNRNVSLVGIRDEKGSIGGDIKFRFEFK